MDEEGDMFEIRRCNRVINYDTPSYLGLMVLQNAKLHMLKFVYDFFIPVGGSYKGSGLSNGYRQFLH